MKRLLAAAVALAPALALAAPSTWEIDAAHSATGFAVKHLVVSTVRGQFAKTSGTITLDDADLARSAVHATIDATSIDTRVPDRDGHLKSPDFLDVSKYPTITFRSTRVEKAGDKLLVTGDLTLHGVTRPVTLEATVSPEVKGMGGEARRAVAATGKISRKDFGLTWNKVVEAGPVVGDEVTLVLEVEAVRKG